MGCSRQVTSPRKLLSWLLIGGQALQTPERHTYEGQRRKEREGRQDGPRGRLLFLLHNPYLFHSISFLILMMSSSSLMSGYRHDLQTHTSLRATSCAGIACDLDWKIACFGSCSLLPHSSPAFLKGSQPVGSWLLRPKAPETPACMCALGAFAPELLPVLWFVTLETLIFFFFLHPRRRPTCRKRKNDSLETKQKNPGLTSKKVQLS